MHDLWMEDAGPTTGPAYVPAVTLRFLTEHEHDVVRRWPTAAAAARRVPGGGRGRRRRLRRPPARRVHVRPAADLRGRSVLSGRAGGELVRRSSCRCRGIEELAWRTRIEGSLGRPEREFNGPVRGWQEVYRDGIAALGDDFSTSTATSRTVDCAQRELRGCSTTHACEGAYGAPEYGGNRDLAGWRAIGFPGDVQPRGYTDDEVRRPCLTLRRGRSSGPGRRARPRPTCSPARAGR